MPPNVWLVEDSRGVRVFIYDGNLVITIWTSLLETTRGYPILASFSVYECMYLLI